MSNNHNSSKEYKDHPELDKLIYDAKSFQESESLLGTIQLVGILHKSVNNNAFVLVLGGPEPVPWRSAIEIKKDDVVKHEVIKEMSSGDKVLRVHISENAVLSVSSKIHAKNLILLNPQPLPP